MKKKNIFLFSTFVFLFGTLFVIFSFGKDELREAVIQACVFGFLILMLWFVGIVLLMKKEPKKKVVSKVLIISNAVALCVFLVFSVLYIVGSNYTTKETFSISTPLFENKRVMIIIPHQDDDINLAGGMIEQYAKGNSNVTVVFTTNGDYDGMEEVRATEAVAVLTELGVEKENIYYLGFGDQWTPQDLAKKSIPHIYNAVDANATWKSYRGSSATYATESIDCYLELPYTKNNYLYSIQMIIQAKMPDLIFAVDYDSHPEHRGASLFFEEALCNILKSNPSYKPLVYKGFCYGTAWHAVPDFYHDLNLLPSKKPEDSVWENSSHGYSWEERVRFPMDNENLKFMLSDNAVYKALDSYHSQIAYKNAGRILNGDKVFWLRRTDGLMYFAEVYVGEIRTNLLNDFKLRDFENICVNDCENIGVERLENKKVHVKIGKVVTANCVYLYDNPDPSNNIIEGYIAFSDGSKVDFGELEKNGSATKVVFSEKQIEWFEVVPTKTEGKNIGLSEIELYNDVSDVKKRNEMCLMASDENGVFAYNYIIQYGDTAKLDIYNLPYMDKLSKEDVQIELLTNAEKCSYQWDGDSLIVNCPKNNSCRIKISSKGASTTFAVSNPTEIMRLYLNALRYTEKISIHFKTFFHTLYNQVF